MQILVRKTFAKPQPDRKFSIARTAQPGACERRVAMRLRLSLRQAAVKGFEDRLTRLCSEMMRTGISREKLYEARMLAISLIHAKRLVALAVRSAGGDPACQEPN